MHVLVLVPSGARAEEEQLSLCDREGGALLRPGALALGAFATRILAAGGDERAPARPWMARLCALGSPLGEPAAGPLAALYEEAIAAGLDLARPPAALGPAGEALAFLHRRLEAARWIGPAGALWTAARLLGKGRGAQALTGVTEIVVRGFLDLTPAMVALVRALSRHRPVRVEVVYDADRPGEWPLADRLLSRLEAGWEQTGDLSVEPLPPERAPSLRGIAASGPGELARVAAGWVRDALEEGIAPDEVAVIALRPDVALAVQRALSRAQVPVAGSRGAAAAEFPLSRALLAGVAGAATPDRRLVEELAAAAGGKAREVARMVARAGVARGGPEELVRALTALEARLPESEQRRAREAAGFVARAGAALAAVAGAGSLVEQLRAVRGLRALLPAGPHPERATLGAEQALDGALDDVLRAAGALGEAAPVSPPALAQVLAQAISSSARREPGPARGAVRVCSPADALGRAFERVLVAGCEGPPWRTDAAAGLVDDALWAEVTGLALDRRRAEERSLFSAAVGTARSALALLAAPVEGGEAHGYAADRMSEEGARWKSAPVGLLAATEPAALLAAAIAGAGENPVARAILESAGAKDLAARAHRAALRAEGAGPDLSPAVAALLAARVERKGHWSATSLESYARCPFLFLARHGLRLGRDDPPSADLSPREEGSLLHRALRELYAALQARRMLPLAPAQLAQARALAREAAFAAFDQATLAGQGGDPRAAPARREELARMLERMVEAAMDGAEGFVPAAFELRFDDLQAGGVRIAGSIDRVDLAPDGVRVLDYKRGADAGGRHKDLAREVGTPGRAFQLPIYLAAAEAWAEEQGTRVERRRAAYLMLKDGRAIRAEPFDGPGGGARLREALHQSVAAVVAGSRAGRFPAAPREPCGPCEQAPVCRYRGEASG